MDAEGCLGVGCKNRNHEKYMERHFNILRMLPPDRLFSWNDLRETSARRIQAAWRGYRVRRKFAVMQDELKREKAAVTIQRRVRHWQHSWAEKQEHKPCHPVHRISEGRLQQLQQEVSRWQENHDNIKFPGMKQMVELHHQVQNRLKSFYCHVSEGSSQHQHQESRCAQLQAFCVLLNELPALSQSENLDVTWYNCSYLPFATAARLAHKQQLQSLNTSVWWKRKL